MRRFLRAVAVVALAGCGYTSQYRPPADGRARPLWRGDHVENNLELLPTARPTFVATARDPPQGDDDVPTFVDPFLTRGFVAMVLLLPIIDIVMVAEHSESEQFSAEAIDEVNAFNAPAMVAPGELVLRQRRGGLDVSAAQGRVARSIEWRGLEAFVRCVPEAQRHARKARRDGRASLALAIVGGSLGVASLGALGGLADEQHRFDWLGAAAGAAALGAIAAGLSRLYRNRANGHAVDALDFYNDAVGARGAVCD